MGGFFGPILLIFSPNGLVWPTKQLWRGDIWSFLLHLFINTPYSRDVALRALADSEGSAPCYSQMSWNWKFLVGSGTCYAARAVWSILLKWSRPPRHLPPPWARVPTPQSSGFPVNFGKKNKVEVPRPISFVFVFVFESFFLWVKYPKNCKIFRCLLDNVVLLDSLDMGDDDESPKYQLEDILNRNWKIKYKTMKKTQFARI